MNLRIPYAVNRREQLIAPADARKGIEFRCPDCKSKVTLRHGPIRQPHFAHLPDTGCSNESVIHKTAKLMIETVLNSDFGHVLVIRKCSKCGLPGTSSIDDDAKTEQSVGNHRIDVVCYRNDELQLGIEVRTSHPVPDEKWKALTDSDIPVIEVDAKQVIESWKEYLVLTQLHVQEQTPRIFGKKVKITTPAQLELRPLGHNLTSPTHISRKLRRITCQNCG